MNKLLVAVFENEVAAVAGLNALHAVHEAGDITLYASGVLARDVRGVVSVKRSLDVGPISTATGLAVGSLIGLLGGPVGVTIGAVTGTLAGAVRDCWAAGVGLDFIEEAAAHLQPGQGTFEGQPRLGYAYQWWIPTSDEGEFMAIGVYGQFVYVNPKRQVVIAKNSAYANYNVDGDRMEYEAIEAFRAIARKVGSQRSL